MITKTQLAENQLVIMKILMHILSRTGDIDEYYSSLRASLDVLELWDAERNMD